MCNRKAQGGWGGVGVTLISVAVARAGAASQRQRPPLRPDQQLHGNEQELEQHAILQRANLKKSTGCSAPHTPIRRKQGEAYQLKTYECWPSRVAATARRHIRGGHRERATQTPPRPHLVHEDHALRAGPPTHPLTHRYYALGLREHERAAPRDCR